MKKKDSMPIGEILSEFLEENGMLKTKIAEHRAVTAWRELLGSGVDKYTKNIFFRRNVLYVQLTSSVLRAELQMNKKNLIDKLNEAAGISVVNDIILR